MNYAIRILSERIEKHRDEIKRIQTIPDKQYKINCKLDDIAMQKASIKHLQVAIALLLDNKVED